MQDNKDVPNGPIARMDECQQNEGDIRGFGDNLCKDVQTNNVLYDQYAAKYDKIQDVTGFNDPFEIVKYLKDNNFPLDSKIIDFGCGTGILGVELSNAGFKDVVGVDGSIQMLEVCK